MSWEAVIGLECHVQLATATKIFSPSSARFGAPPNSLTDPTVLGLPGALPVLNRAAIDAALKLAMAVGGNIRRRSRFARKHYFYPDLPKGYQISQYDEPYCEGGALHGVPLTRIHLEEDAGKNLHGGEVSLVDLNRAGVALLEVVSEPRIRSAAEAAEYMRALRQLVRWLGISDGNMEEGSLRCDANVSLRRAGDAKLGTKTELKNINSFKFVERAIEHEIARQAAVLDGGGRIIQETRLWDADRGTSEVMRTKEEAHDYRYFPDPDLPPLVIGDDWIARARDALPELPAARRARFVAELGVTDDDARVLTEERDLADWFEDAVRAAPMGTAKKVANWVQTEVLRVGLAALAPKHLGELVGLIEAGTISGKIAKDVFAKVAGGAGAPGEIVEREGLRQVTDISAIEAAARAVVDANPKQVEQYRAGKTATLGFFVGQVMKATGGKANPAVVNEILRKLLAAFALCWVAACGGNQAPPKEGSNVSRACAPKLMGLGGAQVHHPRPYRPPGDCVPSLTVSRLVESEEEFRASFRCAAPLGNPADLRSGVDFSTHAIAIFAFPFTGAPGFMVYVADDGERLVEVREVTPYCGGAAPREDTQLSAYLVPAAHRTLETATCSRPRPPCPRDLP